MPNFWGAVQSSETISDDLFMRLYLYFYSHSIVAGGLPLTS